MDPKREPEKFVLAKLRDAKNALEEARRVMFDEGTGVFDSEDVHAVALAQYELGKADKRLRRSR